MFIIQQKHLSIPPCALSALHAIHNLKYDHPILIEIHELCLQITRDEEMLLKGALVGDIPDEFSPYSDCIPRLNKYERICLNSGNNLTVG